MRTKLSHLLRIAADVLDAIEEEPAPPPPASEPVTFAPGEQTKLARQLCDVMRLQHALHFALHRHSAGDEIARA